MFTLVSKAAKWSALRPGSIATNGAEVLPAVGKFPKTRGFG
jgi:hypothetical protein